MRTQIVGALIGTGWILLIPTVLCAVISTVMIATYWDNDKPRMPRRVSACIAFSALLFVNMIGFWIAGLWSAAS